MVHVFEGVVKHDKIKLSGHFEQIALQNFQLFIVLNILFQKRVNPCQIFKPTSLHGQYFTSGSTSNIQNRGIEIEQIGFHPRERVGQKQGYHGTDWIELVEIMSQ